MLSTETSVVGVVLRISKTVGSFAGNAYTHYFILLEGNPLVFEGMCGSEFLSLTKEGDKVEIIWSKYREPVKNFLEFSDFDNLTIREWQDSLSNQKGKQNG
jgi:hypothetical protein